MNSGPPIIVTPGGRGDYNNTPSKHRRLPMQWLIGIVIVLFWMVIVIVEGFRDEAKDTTPLWFWEI
jgi:hypothetical protein